MIQLQRQNRRDGKRQRKRTVLDHGRILERGNHEKLIAEKDVYYQLYTGFVELE